MVRTRRERWTGGWAGPGRYLLAAAPLCVLLFAHSRSDAWVGDFWAHLAAVHELARRPFHPQNPVFGNDVPFVFFSPYAWAVGALSRLLGVRAIDALAGQGLVNLALLLGGLYAFVVTWVGRRAAAVYALLFVLFLWGAHPWQYSSFFHLRSLALVLPYPSTFAFALSLLALAAVLPLVRSGSPAWAALAVPVLAFLWVAHPVNGLFFACGLAAACLRADRPRAHGMLLAVAGGASVALALAWPLFPVGDLWFREAAVIHGGNDPMYQAPLSRVWPALLGAPWLLVRLRRDPRDPLAVLAALIVLAVAFGGLSGEWTFGRLISHAAVLLQLAAADMGAALEERLAGARRGAAARGLVLPAVAALLLARAWPTAVAPVIEESRGGDPHWLAFLETRVGAEDVVLTDLETCAYVPGFSGRVVAFPLRLPFVRDHDQRVQAVTRFFERGVPAAERRALVEKYAAGWILVATGRFADGPARVDELRRLGSVAYASPDYVLLKLARPSGP